MKWNKRRQHNWHLTQMERLKALAAPDPIWVVNDLREIFLAHTFAIEDLLGIDLNVGAKDD